MLSVADVPIVGFHFRGIISAVLWKGKEYRLATYLGAKTVLAREGSLRIKQRDLELEARLLEKVRSSLKAPIHGDMARTIHENAACQAFFKFRKGDCTFFAFEMDQASFEYELRQ